MKAGQPLEEPFEPGNPDHVGHYPGELRQVGVDKVIVQRHKDYASMARGRGWPWDRDNIDYDPSIDEDRSKWDEGED